MSPYAHALCALVLRAESDELHYRWPQEEGDREECHRLWDLADLAYETAGPDATARAHGFLYGGGS